MRKVLSFIFQKFFDPFTTLLLEWSSEEGVLGHLFNHIFRSLEVKKYISHEGHLFFENAQNLISIYKIQKKNWEHIFRF